jgi:hypothetical protein
MELRMHFSLRVLVAMTLAAVLPARALGPGDLMFTSFNADADSWSVVVLNELAPNTTVYFSDNAWDGAAGAFVAGESHHRWNSGNKAIAAGTVVSFTQTDSATRLAATAGTLSRARVPGSSTYGLSQTAETLYAYQGSGGAAPSVFITAISTGDFEPAVGGLSGTGLTLGVTATQLGRGSDYADYAGRRAGLTAAQFQPLAAAVAEWTDLGDGRHVSQASSLAAFQVTAVPEPGAVAMALTGFVVLGLWRQRRRLNRRRQQQRQGAPAPQMRLTAARWVLLLAATLALSPSVVDAAEKVTQQVNLGELAAPLTLIFGDAFNDLNPGLAGLQLLREGQALTLLPGEFFVNQVRFKVDAVDATVIAGTIDLAGVLNIDALQLHLYAGAALPLSTLGGASALAGLRPLISSQGIGPGTGLGNGEVQSLEGVSLPAGTYVLEVRGLVAGVAGGGYAGVINLSPVPEAQAWALTVTGLGLLLGARRWPGLRQRANGSRAGRALS